MVKKGVIALLPEIPDIGVSGLAEVLVLSVAGEKAPLAVHRAAREDIGQQVAGDGLRLQVVERGIDRLDGGLRIARLWGITNGIDTDVFDPETDCALSANNSAADMNGKWVNKRALREEMGLSTDTDAPILGMVTRLAGHKGIDLLCYIGQRLMEREIQLVIVGTGEKQYEYALSALARQYPGRSAVRLCCDPARASRVYAGCDMYLMPSKSEPCGLSQLIAMHYGTVPIVASTGGLRDTVPPYNPETGEGRGYTYQSNNADDFLGAIDRAAGLYYGDRDAWNRLARHDMECDFSWQVPANEYMQLYSELLYGKQ